MDDREMFIEEKRLNTFKNWIYPSNSNAKCTPDKMAEAGFYMLNEGNERDLVKCFSCGKQLDGWEASDDPFEEHKSHAPYCEFVKIGKKEDDLTIGEYLKLLKYTIIKKVQDKYEAIENEMRRKHRGMCSELK